MEAIGKAIGTLAGLYFLIDFFFWNGGILNPSILQRISDALAFVVL